MTNLLVIRIENGRAIFEPLPTTITGIVILDKGNIVQYLTGLVEVEQPTPEPPTPPEPEPEPTPVVLWTGTVAVNGLSVRTGTSLQAPILRRLSSGTRVDVYEEHSAENHEWVRIAPGVHEWCAARKINGTIFIREN